MVRQAGADNASPAQLGYGTQSLTVFVEDVGLKIAREPGLLPSICVDSIEATLAQVTACGGTVVELPDHDSPGSTSWIATFRDPAGNVIGLYQEGPH